jgi:predicted amidohydrolase YtcJ
MKSCFFLLLILLATATVYSQADYILYNGKIFTSDKKQLWAEAVAIKGEYILETGKNDEILKLKDKNTKLIDLERRLVVPGFNDAHNHVGPVYPARRFELTIKPSAPTPWETVKDSIEKIVKEIPAGSFIITTINPDLLDDPQVRRKALDSIAPQHPVMLSAWTGHGKIMNSAALKFFGFGEQKEFLGGRLEKDADQKLTGLVEEYASYQVGRLLSSKLESSKIIDDLKAYYLRTSALGITTIQNMCTQHSALQAIDIYSRSTFPCRVRLIAFPFTNEKELLLNEWNDFFHPLNKINYVSGVKLILDGTPVERLACLRQPYSDVPDEYGRLNFNESQLKQYMQYSLTHQQQIIIHAVGDSSIVTIIRAMRSLHPDSFWKDKRLRLEHAELAILQPGDFITLNQLGIVIVQNPTHLALPQVMSARFNDSRREYFQAMRSLINNNIPLAIGSDGPFNPFLNIMLATMHPDNPKEAITVEEAVIAYTYGSAYAELKENEKGTLVKGKLADLAVLSQDIFNISTDKLPATESLLTFIDGKIVYTKNVLR